MNNTIPELLAPAGNAAAALAAFDAGADAVYAGLQKFNARERSENFTPDSLAKITEYAHKLKKKVYVTFNTLVKEAELPDAASCLAELAAIGPDALIVQDLGVLRLAREYFPSLKLHASTQMGFHNSAGLRLAAAMGFQRVILERQITLEELRLMRQNSPVEIEIFIHGALCCSLAGKCLFSSWHGGHSGNRGRCKQPCRRRFFSKDGNGFFFSTNDLCTVDMIPEIRKAGMASLKIEGRLRQPDYVFNVVSAYRKLLDAPEPSDRKLLGEARNIIAGSFGRKWSHGYYDAEKSSPMVQHDSMGAAGLLCGKVIAVKPNGFEFSANKPVYVGDRLRVQPATGEEGPAITVTKMFNGAAPVRKIAPGEKGFICCDKPVDSHALVFKTGTESADCRERLAALPAPRPRLDLDILINADGIRVDAGSSQWSWPVKLAAADKHPLQPERVMEEFSASSSDRLAAGNITVKIDGAFFLPASELKKIRREFWDFAIASHPGDCGRDSGAAALARFHQDYLSMKPGTRPENETAATVAVCPGGARPTKNQDIQAASIFVLSKHDREAILPEFCPEKRLPALRELVAGAVKNGIRRFRVTALYGLELLREYPELTVTTSLSLPVSNSLAAVALASIGASRVQAYAELEKEALEQLRDKSPLPVEIYRYGRPVLLVTRARIAAEGELKDSRGSKFFVNYDPKAGLTYLRPGTVFSIPHLPGTYDYYDLSASDWHEKTTSTFNFDTAKM